MTSETKKKSRMIEFRNQNSVTEVSKASYNDSLYGDFACDMIIKSGLEKYEHYCHRMILAAASPFLCGVLKTTRAGTMPVILLPDIKTSALEYILRYVYNGEVYVPLVSYGDFLEAFELLQLKGPEEEAEVVTVEAGVNDDIFQTEQCFFMMERLPEEFGSSEMIDEIEEDYDEGTTEEKEVENVTPNKEKDPLDRLYNKLLEIYNRQNIVITPKIREHIETAELVYEDDKLVKAIHSCGLCDTKITIGCHKSVYWQFYNFTRHIVEVCSETVKSDPSPLAKRRRTNVQPKEDLTNTDEDFNSAEEGEDDETHDSTYTEDKRRKSTNKSLIISQKEIDQYKKRLSAVLTAVYERKNVEITPKISEAIERTELVIEDNKMIKAIHFCGRCDSKVSIGYRSQRLNNSWRNFNLMRHLEFNCLVKKKNDGEKRRKMKEEKKEESQYLESGFKREMTNKDV